jgi:hypothetical protein
MQSVVFTHTRLIWARMGVNLTLTIVIKTRTGEIYTRTRLISTRRVQYPHAECDFTRKVWFPYTRELS